VAARLLRRPYPALPHPHPTPAEPADVEDQAPAGSESSKRERARQAYAALVAAGRPVTGARLAEAADDISASYGRALLADFQADPTISAQANGQRPDAEEGER
jgi:hypothetical protein